MSVVEKLKELDRQRQELLEEAKQDALSRARAAVEELNELGFAYRLVEDSGQTDRPIDTPSAGSRRSGVRQEILNLLAQHPEGMRRANVLAAMNAEDKSAQQSISNALANAKKKGDISLQGGLYTLAQHD